MNIIIKKVALFFPFIKKEYLKVQYLRSQLEITRKQNDDLINEKTDFHFIKRYRKYIKTLINLYPLDEAMSMAVGDGYYEVGQIEKNILLYYGLKPNMSILDYGCGSGRLAHALPSEYDLNYLGIDIVEELLDYAKSKTPSNYRFLLNDKLSVPVESESLDLICAFSVFTHLLHEESFIYLEDMKRALKPGGKLIFSFIEFKLHWPVFWGTVNAQRNNTKAVLNIFIEKSTVKIWAEKLGFEILEIVSGHEKKYNGKALGQSLAVFIKNV
jgi:ubiquinone/menaquinone biosynthesis C-methylase UbiE